MKYIIPPYMIWIELVTWKITYVVECGQ